MAHSSTKPLSKQFELELYENCLRHFNLKFAIFPKRKSDTIEGMEMDYSYKYEEKNA